VTREQEAVTDAADEITRLRACLRDVGALSALFSTLHGQTAAAIADALLDALATVLRLDLAYVRFHAPDGSIEVERVRPETLAPGQVRATVGADLPVDTITPDEVKSPFGGGALRLARQPLGLHGKGGVVVAASRRPDFPTDIERFLLRTAENQATVAREVSRYAARLEQTNRAKDEFLASLSHELRTPLTAILGWVRMLASGALGAARAAQAVDVIERNAGSLAALVSDLLDVSRIIADKTSLTYSRVRVDTLAESAVESARPAAEAKAITLEALIAYRGWWLLDPERIRQVLANLLSNAIKFTPAGGRVRVQLTGGADGIGLVVHDTGAGITGEALPYIFERFRQADSGEGRRQGGLGLGLAIARHFVELHGGAIRAESAGPGQGATFTVLLPRAGERAGGETAGPAAAARPTRPPGKRLADRRILVVDDNPDTCEVITAALALEGAHVIAASSGVAGLEAFEAATPDIVLCDLAMPGMTGYDFIREMRARTANGRRVPAVAVTAHAGREDQLRATAAGYDHYLAKPVEPSVLVDLVARLGEQTLQRPMNHRRPSDP
jgi:signal transduction histidine kinase/CheY-like chemotaxis protein